jgi:hypothetical protein
VVAVRREVERNELSKTGKGLRKSARPVNERSELATAAVYTVSSFTFQN